MNNQVRIDIHANLRNGINLLFYDKEVQDEYDQKECVICMEPFENA